MIVREVVNVRGNGDLRGSQCASAKEWPQALGMAFSWFDRPVTWLQISSICKFSFSALVDVKGEWCMSRNTVVLIEMVQPLFKLPTRIQRT